jgi:anti-anti-sigma regulatory factor
MHHAEADQTKNLLTISYSGRVDAAEAQCCVDELPALLADLTTGFRLLADLTGLDGMELACVPHLKRMMELCNQKGAAVVVRVIPDPQKDIGLKIMSLFHYSRRVRIVACVTMAEALQALTQ